MKRAFTILETVVAFVSILLGLYMVIEGVPSNSKNAPEVMIAGAVFVSLGVLVSYSAIKSILWHQQCQDMRGRADKLNIICSTDLRSK